MNRIVAEVTKNIVTRSLKTREHYLKQIESQLAQRKSRQKLSCGNLAHTVATCCDQDKRAILDFTRLNIGIITSYNDMVSAHQPYLDYPEHIKHILREHGHSAQVASAVPAMCDGITQGQAGMELSLFSRDVIAQSTAIGLSHNAFDGALLLGVCDKIAPGQLIGALQFGHLPTAFIPSGPMTTGIRNKQKVAVRQQYAAGLVGKDKLQEIENASYHSQGTCTFYGTANTNQLLLETMGLMLPGAAFVPVNSPLRQELTRLAVLQMLKIHRNSADFRPLYEVVTEKSLVNAMVALLASGGSTNHTIHLIAIAKAAGFILTWDDFALLSNEVPLLTRIYPNGDADINDFYQAGGVPLLLRLLANRDLLHQDTLPIWGSFEDYLCVPELTQNNEVKFNPILETKNPDIIAPQHKPFSHKGGIKVVAGNMGRGIIKVSAVEDKYKKIIAPAKVFESQDDVVNAYNEGLLAQDAIIVVRNSGPAARGMPELHKLMPILGNLMESGFRVALVTDGRLSGASGKVPAVIHLCPESAKCGPLAKITEGDIIKLDAESGELTCLADLDSRDMDDPILLQDEPIAGQRLFELFRQNVSSAEQGATIF
ncbi:phosphogluconate dehydratase [Spirabiliibacterium falconis]|uniref:phosphogluconate dehydratase n=1 Tax=Spirabiliibacterium falconis TaxID=572023 RepID=UPI001AACA217|nr:phosphogluconate dehydratase [Spirabiliibacterium falconis]MBE2894633.1 phosphogluconate dehydratase [Spirabiliibacterium falconis]